MSESFRIYQVVETEGMDAKGITIYSHQGNEHFSRTTDRSRNWNKDHLGA